MREVYRKRGTAVRYEHRHLIRVTESGEAVEEGERFECRPLGETVDLPQIDSTAVEQTAQAIESLVSYPLLIERLIVSEGIAEHQFGAKRWTDRDRRIHLSIAARSIRVLIDLGEFDLAEIGSVVDVLSRAGKDRTLSGPLRLEPKVAAALLPHLAGVAPPNVTLMQTGGGVDGKGEAVVETELHVPPWPNWYRPSYRTRPRRSPLDMRAACAVTTIEPGLPRAVALLAPIDKLSMNVLCVEGDDVYPAHVEVARIEAVATETKWYPYGGGALGAEMIVTV